MRRSLKSKGFCFFCFHSVTCTCICTKNDITLICGSLIPTMAGFTDNPHPEKLQSQSLNLQ